MKVQDKLAGLIAIFKEDPFDPLLHTKPLGFKFVASHAIWLLTVDRRDKIYQRLKKKA